VVGIGQAFAEAGVISCTQYVALTPVGQRLKLCVSPRPGWGYSGRICHQESAMARVVPRMLV